MGESRETSVQLVNPINQFEGNLQEASNSNHKRQSSQNSHKLHHAETTSANTGYLKTKDVHFRMASAS